MQMKNDNSIEDKLEVINCVVDKHMVRYVLYKTCMQTINAVTFRVLPSIMNDTYAMIMAVK